MLYSAIALLAVLAATYAQDAQLLEVPLTSNGKQYSLRFLSSTPLADVTRDFCISNADSLGISPLTEQTLPNCQQPVAKHIQEYVQAALAREPAAQEIVSVQLDIGENKYELRFNPTADSILAVSRDFCIRNAASLNIEPLTEESLPGCQNPVVDYMRAAAVQHLEAKQQQQQPKQEAPRPDPMRTVLTFGDAKVPFDFYPTEESILSVSRNFCINNQEALGISPLTEQSLPGCQQPVVDALVQAVRNDAAAKQMVEIKVNVSGNQYAVRFRPAVEPVAQVARDFCITNADTLGITQLTEETLPACQTPVAQYLQAQLQTLA